MEEIHYNSRVKDGAMALTVLVKPPGWGTISRLWTRVQVSPYSNTLLSLTSTGFHRFWII